MKYEAEYQKSNKEGIPASALERSGMAGEDAGSICTEAYLEMMQRLGYTPKEVLEMIHRREL